MRAREQETDVLIVGGGVGGCAAALAIAQAGYRAVLTEETDWIGGQLTTQATPPDEHGWIERFGCTASYRKFRNGVREYYHRHYPLSDAAREARFLNPGNGWVSPLCHEPRVALAVLEAMLAPFVSSGKISVLLQHKATAAETEGNEVRAMFVRDLREGNERAITARYFLDATELGELLPLTKTEFVTGAESQKETDEPHAPEEAEPENVQAFSVCFAMDYIEDADYTIARPEKYDLWRAFVPRLRPNWSGALLDWSGTNPRTLEPVKYNFAPHREPSKAFAGLWTYRRIIDRTNFTKNFYASDITLVNYPQIDYLNGNLLEARDDSERETIINDAKQLSLSFLYWMQTDAARADGSAGWKGLRLRGDVTGTKDGLAKMPYVRESRRIKAAFTVCEQHVAASARCGEKLAAKFADSVGIGYYRIDLHPSTGGDNYIDVASLPFQIPLGALIPVRVGNLLPACKNIGTTHITNGCYRLHPVEWNIGEAAGTLAGFCLARKTSPRAVYKDARRLADYQQWLLKRGVELEWSADLSLAEGNPHRHAMS